MAQSQPARRYVRATAVSGGADENSAAAAGVVAKPTHPIAAGKRSQQPQDVDRVGAQFV